MNKALTRSLFDYLVNNSGGDLNYGDVVVINDDGFDTITSIGFSDGLIGVIDEKAGIADGEMGRVIFSGKVDRINLSASANFLDNVKTHSVAGQGVPHAFPRVVGDFAQVLGEGENPPAFLFGSPTASPSLEGALGIELDYVEITSNVTPTATTEGTADTVITAGEITLDGSTEILIEFYAPLAQPSGTADRTLIFVLYENGSSIGKLGQQTVPASGNDGKPVNLSRRITPSANDYTYSIRAYVSAGTATIVAGAGGNGNFMPSYIRITKANP